MTYIRKMKDGSEKFYYTEDEMDIMLDKAILKHADDLIYEIRKEKVKTNTFNPVFSNNLQYA
ncbi:MAG: hypothetical protein Q9M94_03580 [Candidatus Gracilibacteria bacterium]|nr:hypothetical protein [Candidatus Gracilibacteria bacterium]MDQ7021942.1 hypothetical protein [Candidatus Gracilibacteria bacterium]